MIQGDSSKTRRLCGPLLQSSGLWLAFACASSTGAEPTGTGSANQGDPDNPKPAEDIDPGEPESLRDVDNLPGKALEFDVGDAAPVYVDLEQVKVVAKNAVEDGAWDLKFQGLEIFTNSGPSGAGDGAAFGPGDELDFLLPTKPDVPFMQEDRTGGAFVDWYAYDGTDHTLWSRYHVYGVKDGERLWKVQVLNYYGDVLGAPVSALYSMRYQQVAPEQGELRELVDLNATAGGTAANTDAKSACVDLDSAENAPLTPAQARESSEWRLCFRRDSISVNGGEGGPADVSAVDLNADEERSLEDLQQSGAKDELAGFEAVKVKQLRDPELHYRKDGVISAFSDLWLTEDGDNVEPVEGSWLIRRHEGEQHYLMVVFSTERVDAHTVHVSARVRSVRDE